MRGRRRPASARASAGKSREWLPGSEPHLEESNAGAITDAKCDEALRALARLLARQAAREIFEHESTDACVDQSTPEDLQ
jgi:hypothetical protein